MLKTRKFIQAGCFTMLNIAAWINGAALALIVYFIVANGWTAISWEFITKPPVKSMTQGGILPCIVGTALLCLTTIAVAMPIGIASAIYLNEYAAQGRLVRLVRLGINNLAGVPSIVFG
ncbi:MAG: phosphate ABC transporter, permease protein PstA, partial [Desulfobacteraceae bacterium]